VFDVCVTRPGRLCKYEDALAGYKVLAAAIKEEEMKPFGLRREITGGCWRTRSSRRGSGGDSEPPGGAAE